MNDNDTAIVCKKDIKHAENMACIYYSENGKDGFDVTLVSSAATVSSSITKTKLGVFLFRFIILLQSLICYLMMRKGVRSSIMPSWMGIFRTGPYLKCSPSIALYSIQTQLISHIFSSL